MVNAKEFVSIVPPSDSRPKAAFHSGTAGLQPVSGCRICFYLDATNTAQMLRDNFSLETWLAIGATIQGLAFLVAGRLALVPAVAYIIYHTLDAYAMSTGWKRNRYMDNVVMKKFSAAFPDENGHQTNKPANDDVVVFLIGTRCNHPLGLLAPGAKDMGGFMIQMVKDLEEHAEEFGFLGMTSWINTTDRTSKSELMEVGYFRSVEGLHAFSASKYHRDAWNWWNKNTKKYPHISIYHETYHVPKGHWEAIYVNSHLSGITSTTSRYIDETTGEEKWASPVVDASKGLMKTSGGRMARSKGDEHDKYGEDPYQ